jgi:hypothetical protein
MLPSSPIAAKESQDASLFQRMYMQIDLRLGSAAQFGLPAVCHFQEAIPAKGQMPDAVIVAVVIVKELPPLLFR